MHADRKEPCTVAQVRKYSCMLDMVVAGTTASLEISKGFSEGNFL
jgi:hypothetical protein